MFNIYIAPPLGVRCSRVVTFASIRL